VLLNNPEEYSHYPDEQDFEIIYLKRRTQFLEDVDRLYLNKSSDLIKSFDKSGLKKITPILKSGDRIIIALEKYNDGEIIYVADSYMFSDKSVLKEDNAVLLNNLFKKYYKKSIAYDKTSEIEKDDIVENKKPSFLTMHHFPYLILQLIMIMMIFALIFIKRFGFPLEYDKYKKRSIVHHLEAVGFFFEKSKQIFQSLKYSINIFLRGYGI